MKAVVVRELCEPKDLIIEDVPDPEPKKGDVLVRVSAAALNFPDVLMIQGKYQVKPPLPFTPGLEVCGTVEALGEGAEGFEIGQRVMAQLAMGGFAELTTASTNAIHAAPDSLSDAEAAAFPLVYQTSFFGLAYRAQLQPGESVLVHSAAGGVGLAAVQIAKALGAGKIIATVGSDEKLDIVREAGADIALNYQTEDWVARVKAETGGGVDVIYDPVGGTVGELCTKCIAFEGRIIVIGFTSGDFSKYRSNHILIKNYSVVGLHWGAYRFKNPARIDEGWRELMELQATAGFKPVVGGTYSMDRIGEAMDHLRSRKAVGKLVMEW